MEAYPYGAFSCPVASQFLRVDYWRVRLGSLETSDIEYLSQKLNDASLVEMQKDAPNNMIICQFLQPDTKQSDADVLARSVLFPGGAIGSDAMPWQKLHAKEGESILVDEGIWPLTEDSFSHPRSGGMWMSFSSPRLIW